MLFSIYFLIKEFLMERNVYALRKKNRYTDDMVTLDECKE